MAGNEDTISVNLPVDVVRELKYLVTQRERAGEKNIQPEEVLRQAIATDSYIRRETEKGRKVIAQRLNNSGQIAFGS